MDAGEFDALLTRTTQLLREVGLVTLGDRESYVVRDPESITPRALLPDQQLIEMLHAFERHLAILDQQTYQAALSTINETIDAGTLEDVVYVPTSLEGEEETYSFSKAPDMNELRTMVKDLIKSLREESERLRREE